MRKRRDRRVCLDTIAIIPARKGSKRVPEKNVALFRGKPLVAHSIEQALQAGIFNHVLVSTDDEKIVAIASGYPVDILQRSYELSHSDATLLNVVRDVVVRKGMDPETCIGLLLVTAPLRNVEDLRGACELFLKSDRKHAVVSVCQTINPITLYWSLQEGKLVPVLPEGHHRNVVKHAREYAYHFNDACVFDSAKNFLAEGRNLFGNRPLPYIMPHERSIFIDYLFQLKLIQMIGKTPGWNMEEEFQEAPHEA
jgi:CMP-N-acetylneuraminic acid synthetase